jgi:hypothetical protein
MPSAISGAIAAVVISASIAMTTVVAVTIGMAAAITVSTVVAAPAVVASSTIVSAAIISMAVVAVIPGTGTDEHAAHEVVRPVVSIWSTSVRIVAVIAVGTDRRAGYVPVTVVAVIVIIVVVILVVVAVTVVAGVVVIIITRVAGIAAPDTNPHGNLRVSRLRPCYEERQAKHSNVSKVVHHLSLIRTADGSVDGSREFPARSPGEADHVDINPGGEQEFRPWRADKGMLNWFDS